MNAKADDYEYCVNEFVMSILALAGIEDYPTFTRSTMINTAEEVQTLLSAAVYLPTSYVTEKVLTILGDGDKAKDILEQMDKEELDMYGQGGDDEE